MPEIVIIFDEMDRGVNLGPGPIYRIKIARLSVGKGLTPESKAEIARKLAELLLEQIDG